jgi:hypothetical protein
MLSIKTVSVSASAERLAAQVQEDTQRFFEEQETYAIKALIKDGLYLFRSESAEIPAQTIRIQSSDAEGARVWLQMKRDDELRDAEGLCLGCGLTVGSSRIEPCYLGCSKASSHIYPVEGNPVILKVLPGRTWMLSKTPKGIFLSLIKQGESQKLKPASPKVIGILRH